MNSIHHSGGKVERSRVNWVRLGSIGLFCAWATGAPDATLSAAEQLPTVVVTGTNVSPFVEDQAIGPNLQPEWTTRRRFSTTRVYVLPPWQIEFEQWWQGKFPRDSRGEHLFQSEVGVGLPDRLQLDLYENIERNHFGTLQHQGNQVELRWALADWGRILFNPTLYGEWKFNEDAPDAYEVKLLLGGNLAPGWHWGFNGFYEQEVGGGRESESGFSLATGYSLIDQTLGAGVEMQVERTSAPNLDGRPNTEVLLGPSMQWRPTRRMHLNLVPLFGLTGDSPLIEAVVVFGFDFGPDGGHEQFWAPTSFRSK